MDGNGMTRRAALRLGSAAAGLVMSRSILTPRKASAARAQKLVFWLQPRFNPVADQIVEEQTMAYARQAGLKDHDVQILKVPGGEVAAKMTAALEVGAPPDVTLISEGLLARWKTQGHLLDISDVMSDLRKVTEGVNPEVIPLTEEGGKHYAVPMGLQPIVFYARMDLLEKAGYSSFPETWDKFIEASLKLNKPPFYAYGMALGTTLGYSDSTHEIIAALWPHGGRLLDRNSRPAVNSPGSIRAFQLIKDLYHKHQVIPRGAVSWDNSGNNKAYQSRQVAFVHDGMSIYSTLLSTDKDLADRTGVFPAPGGSAGRFKAVQVDYYGAFKASPYPEIAKGLIRYFLDEKQHNEFVIGTQGRYMPVYPRLLEDPFWTSKPLFAAIREIGKEGVPMSWEGRMSASLGEVIAQSMLGKTAHSVLVDNVEPAEAVSKLHSEMVATYRRMREPV